MLAGPGFDVARLTEVQMLELVLGLLEGRARLPMVHTLHVDLVLGEGG